MTNQFLFDFKTDLSEINVPNQLNNPFDVNIPEISKIAAKEFQQFIDSESKKWEHDFQLEKGKMFGVLVVQEPDGGIFYLGTVSGKLKGSISCESLVKSVFDDSVDDFFINKGMTELTELNNSIRQTDDTTKINTLKQYRKRKSLALQQQLFSNYLFSNNEGNKQNVLEIFKSSTTKNPPSAAGECAAPKLLQFAFQHQLKPIALAEFWWGKTPKSKQRVHKDFYPACKDKCRPILEYMLNDESLFSTANKVHTI